jgi:non-lysosomal glucosylceramidase
MYAAPPQLAHGLSLQRDSASAHRTLTFWLHMNAISHLPAPAIATESSTPGATTRAAFGFSQSTYTGAVSDLMKEGSAGPYVQPWYTPISCTPADTGMPMGGIGNAFTLTPAGTTPALSLLNGLHVTAPSHAPLRLRNLFYAERRPNAALYVADPDALARVNRMRPLLRPDGAPWFDGTEDASTIDCRLALMSGSKTLYQDNVAALKRWQLALSQRTLEAVELGDSASAAQALIIDVYGAAVALQQGFQGSLTANTAEQEVCGVPAYPADQMHYTSLYPACETRYRDPAHAMQVTVHSFSPVICGDERACSLPVSVTQVTLHNPGPSAVEGTLAWSIENLCGDQVSKARPGQQDAWFELIRTAQFQTGSEFRGQYDGDQVHGITLGQTAQGHPGDFAGEMALALVYGAHSPAWNTSARASFHAVDETATIVECLANGRIGAALSHRLHTGRERQMGAVAATIVVPPGESRTISFCLVLDFPGIHIGASLRDKKYVSFFKNAFGRAQALAIETLTLRDRYRAAIAADHARLGMHGSIPALLANAPSDAAAARFQTMLANTLGFIADATVWDTDDLCSIRECADYPFFNSIDVYFYGSFALLQLLPRLDAVVLRNFAQAVLDEDPVLRRFWDYAYHPHADLPDPGFEGPRSIHGAVPHDLGSPFDPQADAYNWRNVKLWKDLAPKFVLMVLRQYRLSGDKVFLQDCWPAVSAAITYLIKLIPAGQHIPFTAGQDDTFDNLSSFGISVYSGSLWIAGLAAAALIADETGNELSAQTWRAIMEQARTDLTVQLWNEATSCYLFYKVPGTDQQCDDIFADQLLADLWLDLTGLPAITERPRLRVALKAILDNNFRTNGPTVGAANLCAADGTSLDEFQAQDVWLGVQFSLAAMAHRAGLCADSWELLEVQYDNLYVKAKIPFGAPEGFNANRATGSLEYTAGRYLRPGMVWAFAYGSA